MKKLRLSRELRDLILVNCPRLSDRFIENMAIIVDNRAGMVGDKLVAKGRSEQFRRRGLLDLYHLRALRLKPLVEIASKNLDEKNFELFLKSLFRKEKTEKYEVPIDVAICYLDDVGILTGSTAEKAAEHVTSFLHMLGSPILSKKDGLPRNLTAGAYRKQIQRLRRIGVKLLCA